MNAMFQKKASYALLATACIGIPTALFVLHSASTLFSSKFMPHVYCYLQNWNLILLHAISDGLIWLSYFAISLTLIYLVYRTRQDIPFGWMFLAFGTFIIACGFTHLMDVVVLWKPLYWLAGGVKAITAFASLATAIVLPFQISGVLQMVVAARVSEQRRQRLEQKNGELQRANECLNHEITKRIAAEESLQCLSGRLLQAQDDERRRFARELHDSVGQLLTGAALNVSALKRQGVGTSRKSAKRLLSDCAESVKESLREVRTISYLLHPPMLDETGLADALRWYARGFSDRSEVRVHLEISPDLNQLSQELRTAVFRIVQEALTNVHRHSGSKTAEIHLHKCSSQIQLTIRDHGKGMPSQLTSTNGCVQLTEGVGIRGMRERVLQLRGNMKIESTGNGTLLEVILPIENAQYVHTGVVNV
jgi:signal transduction histidine kinase